MQLRKLRRRLARNLLVDIGTPNNPQFVERWRIGKSVEQQAAQLRSRQLNPQDKAFYVAA